MANTANQLSVDEKIDAFEKSLAIDFENDTHETQAPAPSPPSPSAQSSDAVLPEQLPANDDIFEGDEPSEQPASSATKKPLAKLRDIPFISLWLPFAFTLTWLGLSFWAIDGATALSQFEVSSWQNPNTLYILAGIFVPIIIVWAVSFNMRKTRELNKAAQTINQVAEQLQSPDSSSVDSVRTAGQAVRIEIESLNNEMETSLKKATKLESILKQDMMGLTKAYDENHSTIEKIIDRLSAEHQKVLDGGKQMESTIQNISVNMQENMEESSKKITQNVNNLQNDFAIALNATNNEIRSSLSVAEESLGEVLSQKSTEIIEQINLASSELSHSLNESAEKANIGIEAKKMEISDSLSSLESTLSKHTQDVDEMLEKNNDTMAGGLQNHINNTAEMIENKTIDLNLAVSTKVEEVNQSVGKQVDEYISVLATAQEKLGGDYSQKANQMRELMDEQLGAINFSMANYLEQYRNVMAQEAEKVGEEIARKTSEIENQVMSSVLSMETKVDMTLDHIDKNIFQKTENVTKAIIEQTDRLHQIVSNDASPLLQEFQSRGELVAKMISEQMQKAGTKIGEDMENTMLESHAKLEQATASATQVVENHYKDFETRTQQLIKTSSDDIAKINGLLDRLEESNITLSTLMGSSSENLENAGKNFSKQTKEFGQTMNNIVDTIDARSKEMGNQYSGMKEISETVLADIVKLGDQFAGQGESLSKIVQFIEETNNNVNISLTEKNSAIEKLAKNLTERNSQLENIGTRFNNLLSGSIENAESKMNAITAGLAKNIAKAADEATQKFADASNSMQNIASDIKEVKQNEAQQQPAANNEMRQKVIEQINALKGMNIVANGNNGNNDNSGNKSQVSEIVNNIHSETASTANNAAVDSLANNSSWVKELLNRASTADKSAGETADKSADETADKSAGEAADKSADEVTSKTEQPPITFDSLSSSMANAILQNRALELWTKYQSGEKQIFANGDFYTSEGMATFTKAQNSYNVDSQFKLASDNYMVNFEKTLSNVAKAENGATIVLSYLASDAGRIYTMLAHLSGRLN